ncbi:MAG: hypothetical protein H8Z69_05510 [Nanohaloarchaea archaeon]|nr:hypothetical protein [Candidatus Nanohaloarchaea archaeon]
MEKLLVEFSPEIVEGINLVAGEPDFQSLLGKKLEREAVWIDSGSQASTYRLAAAGGEKILEKVYIGRAFTALQHYWLCQRLEEFVTEETEILVIPSLNLLYEEAQISSEESEELFKQTLTEIKRVREKYNLKVLVSLVDGSLRFMLEYKNRIEMESTSEGRKTGEQHFYRKGMQLQTTIPYWHSRKTEEIKLETV